MVVRPHGLQERRGPRQTVVREVRANNIYLLVFISYINVCTKISYLFSAGLPLTVADTFETSKLNTFHSATNALPAKSEQRVKLSRRLSVRFLFRVWMRPIPVV